MTSIAEALASGRCLVLDGAMGTELTRIGRRIGSRDWVASTLGAEQEVRRIHRAYLAAGAEVHIANTFATARHVLADVGLEAEFERLNRDLVRICREEVSGEGPVWIAGSVSTYVIGSDRANLPRDAGWAAEQAALLAVAGCDLIVLEMLFDVEVSGAMVRAAATAGLPLSIGLTCGRLPDGEICLAGAFRDRPEERIPLAAALPRIAAAVPAGTTALMTIMHSDIEVSAEALTLVRQHWDGPVGAYPNSGRLIPPDGWDHASVAAPETFAAEARRWAEAGTALIGGCCGLGPAHIAALAGELGRG